MTTFVRSLISTYLTSEGGITLEWNHDRGGDFRCIANTLYVIQKFNSGTINNQGTVLQLEKWLKIATVPTGEFRETVHATYSVLLMLVRDTTLNGVFRTPARVSPIEFIMIVLFVSLWKDKLTPKQLCMGIELMRKDVRKHHKDISQNSRVGKTMFDFIRGFKGAKVKSAGGGGETAGQLAENMRDRIGGNGDSAMDVDEEEVMDAQMRSPASPRGIQHLPTKPAAAAKTESTPTLLNKTSQSLPLPLPPPKPKPDRLAAIREAKAKLSSMPSPLLLTPTTIPAGPRSSGGSGGSERPVLSVNTDPLESTLMSRVSATAPMSSTSNTTRSAGPGPGRSMYASPRAMSRSRSRSRERDRDRDRLKRRSYSRERSPPRPRKSWDDGRNNDYRSRYGRGRSPRYSGGGGRR